MSAEKMTAEEVSQRYQIPMSVLEEYRGWGLCGVVQLTMDDWRYDDKDLERLSTIMALHDMGFQPQEIETYMRLLLQGNQANRQRLQMLEQRRDSTLDEIHLKEKQLQRMDYLRSELRKGLQPSPKPNKLRRNHS